MTHLEPEDILRRALHAAAESVEPAAEGLTQIRARLSAPRPLPVAWLVAGWETASQFVMLRLEAALDWLASSLRTALRTADGLLYPVAERLRPLTERLEPVMERLRPALAWLAAAVAWIYQVTRPRTGSRGRPSPYRWVRPAMAMATVVLVAVVGAFALSGLSGQIVREGLNVFSSSQTKNGSGGGTNNSGVNGGGTPLQPSSGPSGKNGTAPSPSPSCTPTAKAEPHPTATATPTVTPTQQPSTSPPSSSAPPSSPPPSTSPPSSPPPSAGPDQNNSSAPATQNAQDSALVVIGAMTRSGAAASPSPSPCSSKG